MNRLGLGRTVSAWIFILACLIGMVSRQSLGDDTLNGRDDGPNRHQHSVLSLKNASLNFGTVPVGDSTVLADTLINNSASTVVVKRAILADGNFKVDVPLPLTLAAGQSSPINVTFSPKVGGTHAAHLFISGDNSNQTAVLPLFGTAMTSTTPQLGVSPSSVSFGSVIVGSSSQPQVMTLTNPGGSNLTISQVTETGSGFGFSGITLPLTLPAGQSVSCSVTFAPQSTGAVIGGISITSVSGNGKGGGPKKGSSTTTVPLSGTGAAPGSLAANPNSISFANVQVGSSQKQTATLTNSGSSSITVSQATVTGSGFSLAGLSLPLSLGAGQSATFSITFAPQSSGSSGGGVAFTSNAANATLNLPLSGTAVSAGSLAASPASMGFGSVSIGSSRTTSETLTNSGGSNLSISQATATGSGFSLSGLTPPLTLSPGQSTSFNVTFAPQSSGLVNGGITISDNGSNPTVSISLSGTGVSAGTVAANPAGLSFGTVQVGSNTNLSGTLTNSGSSSVTISQANVTGSAFAVNGLSMPVTLNAGQSTTFNVTFAPTSGGAVNGNLAIGSNASNPTLNIGLSGTGATPGAISAAPANLSFGSIQTGSSNSLPETITNSGSSSVTISQVASSSASYSVSGIAPPVTLNAGQNYTFNVTFAPTASGNSSGTLSLSSNASNPTLSIPLSGSGTTPGSLAVNPSSINFGNVVVGTTQSQTATLSASSAPITVSSAGVSGSEFSVSGLSFPLTLAAGSTASFKVTFTPQASGTASANVSFASNATNSPVVESLGGSGTPAPQHSVALSWNASTSTVSGYNVYRGSVSGGPYAKINSALDASAAYSDGNVQAGQTYYYVVTAVDTTGNESAYSNQVQAVIPTP